jgi:FkbM family methyltransferase
MDLGPLATKGDILACFRLLLGRDPHIEERAGHFGLVGAPLDSVVSSYLQSMEFRKRGLLCPSDEVELVVLDEFSIYVAKDDHLIAPGIRGGYEPDVARAFVERMGNGTVIDLGANCGYYSLLAASRGASVYAFEPSQRNLRLLHASVALNDLPRITIIAGAASSRIRTLAFAASYTNGVVADVPPGPQGALEADYVTAVRVDDVIPSGECVTLIKIDVEGHEYHAITGAVETIRRCRPVIISEFSPGGIEANSKVSPESYLDLLRSLGYHIYAIGRPDVTKNDAILALTHEIDHIDIVAEPLVAPMVPSAA